MTMPPSLARVAARSRYVSWGLLTVLDFRRWVYASHEWRQDCSDTRALHSRVGVRDGGRFVHARRGGGAAPAVLTGCRRPGGGIGSYLRRRRVADRPRARYHVQALDVLKPESAKVDGRRLLEEAARALPLLPLAAYRQGFEHLAKGEFRAAIEQFRRSGRSPMSRHRGGGAVGIARPRIRGA